MKANEQEAGSALERRIADRYRREGYEVTFAPKDDVLPFDLGGYVPDLLVKTGPNQGYIIEVKSSTRLISIDRYKEIAELVSQHPGWRFLLVTGDEEALTEQNEKDVQSLSWENIEQRRAKIDQIRGIGPIEAEFLSLWTVLEALLRRQARNTSVPVELLATLPMIKHLYSQGELSMAQYDRAINLLPIRNAVAHGGDPGGLERATEQLRALVDELLTEWEPKE